MRFTECEPRPGLDGTLMREQIVYGLGFSVTGKGWTSEGYLEFLLVGSCDLSGFVVRFAEFANDFLGNIGVGRVLKVGVLSPE